MSLEPEGGFQLDALRNVTPLRPLRILLVGRDARFMRAIAFLFGRRGYDVRRLSRPERIAREAESFGADVVVIDGEDAVAEMSRQATALVATTDSVGVVVVTTREAPPGSARLQYVEKWAPFDELAEAVERSWAEIAAAPSERSKRSLV